jgi:CheY-like chemotaxis protein
VVEFSVLPYMPQSAILGGITIVLVEDYPDTLYRIAHFLTRHGAKVFPRPDAFEGLQAVREHRPDIVLSDIRLTKRDGFELLRDIRALGAENGGNVPVIAMTAFGGFVNARANDRYWLPGAFRQAVCSGQPAGGNQIDSEKLT